MTHEKKISTFRARGTRQCGAFSIESGFLKGRSLIGSPTLSNMTLDGLEQTLHSVVPRRSRVNFVRYADDFIVTGKSKTLLETKIKPAIEAFLADRGLELSKEKTVITHIKDAFTFLGQTFRKHGSTLHVTPSKEGVHALVRKVGDLIRQYRSSPMEGLITKLNSTLRGWANYHRHVVSSEAFAVSIRMSLNNYGACFGGGTRTSPRNGLSGNTGQPADESTCSP